ncbi:iron hydrogenase [Carboxydothermus islandicus]|uniref:Iron hydrogenase n=1 Tax=Carboxydothermus islandicus TaxID=661089 RepID=A0A1L8D1L7_9THEO|nr:nickel-dependent hydrogenase large subunit [Carboxydothermus islandicus]GAV25085.1 iron hydrogenase [Carboxydothermus islandicus]
MAQKIVVDPVTRIEGHLKIEVMVDGGKVVDAKSSGVLYRGIETILVGRDPRDAQQITQRICGVCPTAHATASTFNLDNAFGIQPPKNGRILRNLIFGANYLQSHILHFYHLSALDYVKGPDASPFIPRYEGDYRLPNAVNQKVVEHYILALEMRKKAHEMLAIFGGKMPHVVGIVPGGSSETVDAQKIIDFRSRLKELTSFIDNVYIPDVLTIAEYYKDYFDIGRGCQNLMSYGGFPQSDDGSDRFLKAGVFLQGQEQELNPEKITEHLKYSWFDDNNSQKHPREGVTAPKPGKDGAYSWMKAPRYDGHPMEVGPLARMWIGGEKKVKGLGEKAFSVLGRHLARALEASRVAHAMEEWLLEIEPGKPTHTPFEIPKESEGMGLTEAPRGALGHWIKIKNYKIANYQAVVPTTWNASPRDDNGVLGPIEQALIGTPVKDPENPIEVARVVRAFDPCLACAVHLFTPGQDLGKFKIY